MADSHEIWTVDAPHFNAGLVERNYAVVRAAPIIKYMRGWPITRVASYCRKKGWSLSKAEPYDCGTAPKTLKDLA